MTTIPRDPDAGAALGPYVRAIRSHPLVLLFVTCAALGAAAMLLATRASTYESTAELLVTPLQQDDRTFLGITLLRDSGDPTRTVQTAAALIASPIVARRTANELGGGASQESVEEAVDVEPLGESNIVGVTARAATPNAAATLANGYARNSLTLRSEVLREQVTRAIDELLGLPRLSEGGLSPDDRTRLSELRAVRDRGDPSLSLSQNAQPPRSPTDAPPWLVLALALVAGITLAAIVAVLVDRLDRRVRDVDEFFALAPIPILARVPTARFGERGEGLDVPPAVRESFRTLQIQIDQRRSDSGLASNTIVVTSPSSGDGKTTTAICLALALVAAGRKVILVDCDLRRPDIGRQLGLDTSKGLVTLLTMPTTLNELLQPIDKLPTLRVLTGTGGSDDSFHLQLLTSRLAEILFKASSLAEFVIVDTAPLGVVGDALAVTPHADQLLLVGRAHNSDRRAVETAVELLGRARTPPTGWVVIGDDSVDPKASYYYGVDGGDGEAGHQRRGRWPWSPVG